MGQRFQANSRLFALKNPRAAALAALLDTDHTELPASLDDGFKEITFGQEKVLVVYGIGTGAVYLFLKDLLTEDPTRIVVFLEDDLYVVSHFLETETASLLLKDPQAHLYFIENNENGREALQEIAWGVFPEKVLIRAAPFYEKNKRDFFHEVRDGLLYEHSSIHTVLDEYTLHGIPFFRNFWANLSSFPDSYRGNALFSKFKNIPAIIVAAGPSLNAQCDHLAELQDRALIFAGGSSVNALTDAGIRPHFGAAIDPNPMQYIRLRQGLNFEIPFFYRLRAYSEAVRLITGPKLYLRGGDGYNITDWYEKKLGIRGKVLGGGHSVANFSIEIASALGCSPIILVGFDLAYTNQMAYAEGVDTNAEFLHAESVERKDIHGKPVTTLWKWLLEADWIAEFKKKKRNLKLYNATEGGIQIPGVKNISLQDAASRFMKEPHDLDGLVHTAIYEAGKIDCDVSDISKATLKMQKSLEKTFYILDTILKAIEHSSEFLPLEDTASILLLEELHREDAYKYVLEVFDRMKTKLDYFKRRFALSPLFAEHKQKAFEKKLMMEHYLFLKEVIVVNVFLTQRGANAKAS